VKIGSGHTEFAKGSVGDRFVFSDCNIAIGSINIENVHLGFPSDLVSPQHFVLDLLRRFNPPSAYNRIVTSFVVSLHRHPAKVSIPVISSSARLSAQL
jgi:hypothetical protein